MKKTEKKARDKIGAFNGPRLLARTEVLRPAFAGRGALVGRLNKD